MRNLNWLIITTIIYLPFFKFNYIILTKRQSFMMRYNFYYLEYDYEQTWSVWFFDALKIWRRESKTYMDICNMATIRRETLEFALMAIDNSQWGDPVHSISHVNRRQLCVCRLITGLSIHHPTILDCSMHKIYIFFILTLHIFAKTLHNEMANCKTITTMTTSIYSIIKNSLNFTS